MEASLLECMYLSLHRAEEESGEVRESDAESNVTAGVSLARAYGQSLRPLLANEKKEVETVGVRVALLLLLLPLPLVGSNNNNNLNNYNHLSNINNNDNNNTNNNNINININNAFAVDAAANVALLLAELERRRIRAVEAAKRQLDEVHNEDANNNNSNNKNNKNNSSKTTKHNAATSVAVSRASTLVNASSRRLSVKFELAALALRKWIFAANVASPSFNATTAHVLLNRLFHSKGRAASVNDPDNNDILAFTSLPFSHTPLLAVKQQALQCILEAENILTARNTKLVADEDSNDKDATGIESNRPALAAFLASTPWKSVTDMVKQHVYNDHDFCADLAACCDLIDKRFSFSKKEEVKEAVDVPDDQADAVLEKTVQHDNESVNDGKNNMPTNQLQNALTSPPVIPHQPESPEKEKENRISVSRVDENASIKKLRVLAVGQQHKQHQHPPQQVQVEPGIVELARAGSGDGSEFSTEGTATTVMKGNSKKRTLPF